MDTASPSRQIPDNTWCKVTLDVIGGTFGSYLISINGGTSVAFNSTVETKTLYVLSGSSSSDVVILSGAADGEIDNVVIKAIPGHHAIAL